MFVLYRVDDSDFGVLGPGRGFTQDTAGVPGRLEAGDRFGAAVAVGLAFTYTEGTDVAVGVPDEDIGGAVKAGAINLINLKIEYEYSHDGPRLRLLRQGTSLLGPPRPVTGSGPFSV